MRFHHILTTCSTLLVSTGTLLGLPISAAETVTCWMNTSQQTCTIKPWGQGGFEISFSGSAIYRFVPAGPPTTDRRRMRDEQGQIWLMSGHHSFTMDEQSPFRNRITVSSAHHSTAHNANGHDSRGSGSPSTVKLNGHGKATVTLYARPDFAAPISGMGVSGEVLNTLGCLWSGSLHWCRVSYRNQEQRELWVPTSSLTFLGDGD